jgi:hypothetical protein
MWDTVMRMNRAQALMALALAIEEFPCPEQDVPYLVPLDLRGPSRASPRQLYVSGLILTTCTPLICHPLTQDETRVDGSCRCYTASSIFLVARNFMANFVFIAQFENFIGMNKT